MIFYFLLSTLAFLGVAYLILAIVDILLRSSFAALFESLIALVLVAFLLSTVH